EEPALFHSAADRVDHLATQHDVRMQMVAAKIEEAIFEPDLFRIVLLAKNRHRQFTGRAEDLDLVDIDLDLAGRQFKILGASRTAAHLTVNTYDPFGAQGLRKLDRFAVGIGHALCEPIVVTQIDEQAPAMIANAVAPSGQPHGLSDVTVAKCAAGV